MRKVLMGLGGLVSLAVLAVVAVVGVASQGPDTLHVERSKVVAGTPVDVWPLVSDLRAFVTWSPWQELDPDQHMEFSDPSAGVGAHYAWKGDDAVGSGRMEIVEVAPMERVVEDLHFIEPFTSDAKVVLALVPDPAGTKVTWSMDSENDLMGKVMNLFMDMDAMLGADFEKGLTKLDVLSKDARATREAAEEAARKIAEEEALRKAAEEQAAGGAGQGTAPGAP